MDTVPLVTQGVSGWLRDNRATGASTPGERRFDTPDTTHVNLYRSQLDGAIGRSPFNKSPLSTSGNASRQ